MYVACGTVVRAPVIVETTEQRRLVDDGYAESSITGSD
jgi:hypothetical protein